MGAEVQFYEVESAMSSQNVLYNVSDKTISHEDRWDDTLLIKQYEETEARVKKMLQKKLTTNTTSATESEQSEYLAQDENTTSGNVIPLQAKNSKKKKRKRNKKSNNWHTGDSCRAKYSEDGIIYEATILAMHPTGNCQVRFVGYNNEEEVSVNKLKNSNGATARKKQEEEADMEYSRESDIGSSICDSDAESETDDKSSKQRERPSSRQNPRSMMPPPPPSMGGGGGRMFGAPSHLPHLPPPPALALGVGEDPESAEALHTMLMSWYMTGYHTGYYQGLQHAKPRRK